jgi:hypothetical protein
MAPLLKSNLADIKNQIDDAANLVGRDPDSITIVAVSKTVSIDHIKAAYDLGIRDFGESRLQELQTKVHQLPADINWHFIGKLQSNKAKVVASISSAIHTIENDRQIQEFAKQDRTFDGFIQVNIGREPQKSGIFSEELDTVLSSVLKCYQIRFRGLMGITPLTSDPEESRAHFRDLARLNRQIGGECLSMGMSNDFNVAIQEGSTHIRVGSALFGHR